MCERRRRLPAATGEIGEVHGAAFFATDCTLRCDDRAERRRVVDIHVGRRAFAQAIDQPVVLDVVHAAVARAFATAAAISFHSGCSNSAETSRASCPLIGLPLPSR